MRTAQRDLAARLAPDALQSTVFARLAVEAIAVAEGLKPAARFTACASEASEFRRILSEAGMAVESYVPEPDEWGYRHATPAEREVFTERDVRVYYAAGKRELAAAIDAQRARDDQALGRALGYPDCCITANLILGGLSMTDMVRVARTRGRRDWRLNIFLTEMDSRPPQYYLISHFPCRLGCPASIDYAASLYEVLTAVSPQFAAELKDFLSLPVLLRDERRPPENRRYGNYGCVLHGVTVGDMVLYRSWQSLRKSDDLADAGLDSADCLARDEHGVNLFRTETGEQVAWLDAEKWQLVTF